jgi:TP901 family phage tail tape measure protein
MADVNANIGVHIDTSAALAELKNLQRQLANFHASIAKGSAASAMAQKSLQTNLLNSINATGKFTAQMGLVRTSTESFTHALEKNKLGMRDYFRYAGASTKTFGRLFKQEFDTINKVAEDRVKKMQTQYIKMGRDASGAMKAMAITPTSLNMKDYATQTAMAAQKQALFNQLVRQGSTNLLNFGKNTQWAGRQLMVGFTIPLAYFGTTAAKTFMDLEKQALKFKRVYGDMFTTTEQTNKALGEVEKLAKEFTKYGVAVTETMEMAASAAAMGKVGADLTAQVAEATRLAVLGSVEQEQALETTISLTNAFGIASEDLAKKIDFLNSVENQTVVSIEDLTIAIPKAGPVVKQLGGDVEDLAFFLTAMKEGGINASEGANALKSGLASLINPSDKAAKMLNTLGINIKGIVEGNVGNVRQTVIDFSRALDTLDPLNRARAIEQLFGKFQFSRLSTLFQNVTQDGTQASKVLQLAGASVEELAILSERELKAVEDAVGTNFKAAVEELKVAIAPIGKTFLEAVTPIVRVIGDLLERFNNLGDGTKKFIVVASSLVGIIGPVLLMTFGLLANGVANIIKLFLALRTGFMKLGGNSQILAEQTNYLNSEQLEAATVAASLNQAHTRLTQSFTAEASAVRALRQAYIDATVAASNFARANPGMMVPGKGKAPKKFGRGTKSVPGTGNKDNVPAVLMPGEAVIPTNVAQDPKYQPIIEAMLNGTLQAFGNGTDGAQPFANSPKFVPKIDLNSGRSFRGTIGGGDPLPEMSQQQINERNARASRATLLPQGQFRFGGTVYTATSQTTARAMVEKINSELMQSAQPGGVGPQSAVKTISNRMNGLVSKGKPLTPSKVFKHISGGKSTSGGASANNRQILKLRKEINAQSAGLGLDRETKSLDAALKGAGLTDNERKEFLKAQESHINKPTGISGYDDPRKWQSGQVVSDFAGLNNYLNRAGQPNVKNMIGQILADPIKQQQLGYTDKQIRQLAYDHSFAATGKHPTTAKEFQSIARIAKFEVDMQEKGLAKLDKIYQAKGVVALTSVRQPSFYKKLYSRAIQLGSKDGSGTAGRVKRGQLEGLSASERRNIARTGLGLITVGKGETLLSTTGKAKKVTGQTGEPKPSNVRTRNTSDRRIVPTRGISKVIPRGRAGLSFMAGAEGGLDTTGKTGATIGSIAGAKQLSQAQIRAALDGTSVNEAKRRIKAEGKLTTAIEDQTKTTTETTKQSKALGANFSKGVNVFSGLTIAASFAGGKVGEMAQKITPFVVMLSTLTMLGPALKSGLMKLVTSLASNPIGLMLAVLAGMYVSVKLMQKHSDKQAKAQSDYIEAISSSTEKMKKVGQLTGNVGASEIMARRREGGTADKFTTQFERAGQQFGTNFLDSEVGKSIYETFKTNLSKGGTDAVKNLSLELSTYVSDGLMTAEDANSVARSIGINMSDMTIASNISGQLRSLIGPDGQDLLKNPLNVRIKIGKEQTNIGKDIQSSLEQAGNIELKTQLGAQSAAANTQALEIIQAQRDAQAKMYDDQLRGLRTQLLATTDKEKQLKIEQQISTLSGKQASDDNKFAEQKQKAIQDQLKAFRYTESKGGFLQLNQTQNAFMKATKEQVKTKYKGTGQEAFINEFLTKSAETGGRRTSEIEVILNTMVGAGDLTPMAGTKLLNMFGKAGEAKLETLLTTTLATKDPGKIQELVNLTTGIKGKGGAEVGLKVFTEIAAEGQEGKFDDRLSALAMLQKLDGKEINLALFLKGKDGKANPVEQLDKLVPLLNKIEKIKTPITKSIVQDIQNANPDMNLQGLIADWEKYKNLPDELKKTAIQTYISIYKTITDENAGDMAKEEAKSRGLRGKAAAEFIKNYSNKDKLAALLNRELYPDAKATTPIPGGAGGGGEKGKRDTTLDNLLSQLKFYRDARIDAEGGTKELMRVLGGTKDIKVFNGLSQSLLAFNQNLNSEEFIDWIGGLEKAIQKGYVKINKKGKAVLTELGEAAQKAYNEVTLGAFQDTQVRAIRATIDQREQFLKLKAAGVDSAQALELLGDANLMTALRSAKNTQEIKESVEAYKALKAAQEETLRATDPQQYFKNQRAVAEQAFDVEERIAKLRHENATKALGDEIDANNKIIDAAQRRLEVDESIGSRRIDIINQEIEALQRSLSLGIDKQMQALDDESRKLSEDQTTIANTVDQINKKYDDQEKALSRIYEINQDLAEQEKERMGLADAITQGDISAASQAVQEMRARSAGAAGSVAQELLGQVRDKEIAGVRGGLTGKTADEISARQYQIDRQNYTLSTQRLAVERQIEAKQEAIYQIEVKRQEIYKLITNLEDRNFALNEQIKLEDEILKKQRDAIQAQRDKWDQAQLAIDIANTKTEEFQNKLKNANGILTEVSKLWNNLTDKNLKITIKQIEDVISGNAKAKTPDETAAEQAAKKAAADAAAAKTAADKAVKEANDLANKVAMDAAREYASPFSTAFGGSAPTLPSEVAKPRFVPTVTIGGAPAGYVDTKAFTPTVTIGGAPAGYRRSVAGLAMGGMVPKYFASGGFSRGTDTIPAMLTPGEFVVRKNAVDKFGVNNLNKINDGMSAANSVYNYSVNIDVAGTDASSSDIARAVIGQIKYIDSQRIRGQR